MAPVGRGQAGAGSTGLDRLDLRRFWRFARPAAIAGFAASALVVAATFWSGAPRVPPAVLWLLFLGIFPLHLGTVLTLRRVGTADLRTLLRSFPAWLQAAILILALGAWLVLMTSIMSGSDSEQRTFGIGAAGFYAVGVAVAVSHERYRQAAASDDRNGRGQLPPLPATSRPSDRRWMIGILQLAGVLGFVALLIYNRTDASSDAIVGSEDDPFYVATFVESGRIDVDEDRARLVDFDPAIEAALCRNYHDWLDDRTLTTDLVMLDDPGLLRSAELLDNEFAGDEVALEAESLVVRGDGPADIEAALLDGDWSPRELDRADRYLELRAQRPSADASRSYVTYIASRSTSVALVVRLAIDPDAERVERPAMTRIGDLAAGLPNGSSVRMNESICW